ncbi:hypothetical protein BGZ65_012331, partial [Modicella reniformis]
MFRLSAQTTRKVVQRFAVQNAKNMSMVAAGVATAGALAYLTMESVDANMLADGLHPPKYPWDHKKNLATFDHAA